MDITKKGIILYKKIFICSLTCGLENGMFYALNNIINYKKEIMENVDDTINEKPKGNMLQNENREDEASTENLNSEESINVTKKVDENAAQKSSIKTDEELNKI